MWIFLHKQADLLRHSISYTKCCIAFHPTFSRLFVYCLLFTSSCPFAGLGPKNPNLDNTKYDCTDQLSQNCRMVPMCDSVPSDFPGEPHPVAMIRNESNIIMQIEKMFTTSFREEPWKRDWSVYRGGCRQGRWITTSELHKSP